MSRSRVCNGTIRRYYSLYSRAHDEGEDYAVLYTRDGPITLVVIPGTLRAIYTIPDAIGWPYGNACLVVVSLDTR
jgi:hypothetical protein